MIKITIIKNRKTQENGDGENVDSICNWFFVLCRDYGNPCEVWDTKNRFRCGNSDSNGRSTIVFMVDGRDHRFVDTDGRHRRQDNIVLGSFRTGDGSILVVLF